MEIRRATKLTSEDIAGRDFSFTIDAEISKPYDHLAQNGPMLVTPTPAFTKDYGFDETQFENITQPDAALFTLVLDHRVYGYVHASKSWNNMVLLEWIALDSSVRGKGHGGKLLDEVMTWARQLGVAGVRLETQANNVAACRFYKRYGFRFGGYDEYLYRGIPKSRGETALFWYLIFE